MRRLGLFLLSAVLTVLLRDPSTVHTQEDIIRRVNIPFLERRQPSGDIYWTDTAIFWFGRVTPTENHTDVRVGYTDDELLLRLQVFDRRLWYDTTPSPDDLTAWDAATLHLDLDGNAGNAPDANAYRFVAQLNWWEPRDNYQAVYQGDGSGWVTASIPYTTTTAWRGNAPNNDDGDDRGWVLIFRIPFTSLGLSGPPPQGTAWGLAVILHDRDDAASTSIPDRRWPETMDPDRPATWGQLAFDLPTYTPLPAVPGATVTIRHKLDGAVVVDAAVGGGSTCGNGLDFWTEWGEANYAGSGDFNIQNQTDVADWPCFSKYYVTFPLDALPPSQVVLSATLTLHKLGHAGAPGQAYPSLIQVFTVAEDWDEATLTWNNAPLAVENVSASWVDPAPFPGWPGTPFTWDVSGAAAEAYAAGEPLRLALYSADGAYHSGKYFVTSDTGDWNAEGRPTLTVVWGEPLAVVHKGVRPATAEAGQTVTYALTLLGNGQALTLTDNLPAQVSAPGPIQVWGGPAADYDAGTHRLAWSGSPGVGQPLTITFPVTLQVAGPLAVLNTVVLTDAAGLVSTDTAVLIVDAHQIWLPLVMRNR